MGITRQQRIYRDNLTELPPHLREILLGMVLGDAHIGRYGTGHARIRFMQGVRQRVFIEHLFALFQDWRWAKELNARVRRKEEKTYTALWFATFTHPVFTQLHEIFYRPRPSGNGWIKVIPDQVAEWITPRVLAYHVMCDGSRNKKSLIIHTDGYTKKQSQAYVDGINQAFGLHGYVTRATQAQWYIRFPATDLPALQRLLKPYLLESFYYKLDLPVVAGDKG